MLSKKVNEIAVELISKKEFLEDQLLRRNTDEVVNYILELLEKLNIYDQRMLADGLKVKVELRGYYDLYQMLNNKYICDKLNEVQDVIIFYPYFLINNKFPLTISDKEINNDDIYLDLKEEPLNKYNLYIYIDNNRILSDEQKVECLYKISNMIFDELEETVYISKKKIVDLKMKNMLSITDFFIPFNQMTIDKYMATRYIIEGSLKQHKFKKGVNQIITPSLDLILENQKLDIIKQNLPFVTFYTVEVSEENKDNLKDYILDNLNKEAYILSGSKGENHYIDYIVFNEELFIKTLKKSKIEIKYYKN